MLTGLRVRYEERVLDEYFKEYNADYIVSSEGYVISLERLKRYSDGRVELQQTRKLKPTLNSNGYYHISFYVDGVQSRRPLHRVVAELFIANPESLQCVNHIDGNKLNNCVDNLEWISLEDNTRHAAKNGLIASGSRHGNAKLNEVSVSFIKLAINKGLSNKAIAALNGVSEGAIGQIRKGNNWKNVIAAVE